MNGGVIPFTPIAVDFWKIRECPQSRIFLLTHLHGDHITGLTSSWNYPIYCSEITGKLLELKHGIKKELIHTLQIGCAEIIYLDPERSEQMSLTALDANHCPGAVMFLMEGYFGTILHTGDFRFTPEMIQKKPLSDFAGKIDQLYLDNTYCSRACQFPSREKATEMIVNIIESHPSAEIVLGLRNLGKENLLCKLAVKFQEFISVPPHMLETLQILEAPDVFVRDSSECRIRVLPFHNISNKLVNRLNEVTNTIVILPTALYCGIDAAPYENQEKVFIVPYSDHSSYAELNEFVAFIKPGKIIPVVKAKSRGPFGLSVADRADMTVFQKYTSDGWNLNFDIPKSVKRSMMDGRSRAMLNKAGKKRKARQTSTVMTTKRAKRGVIYNSPSHSHSSPRLLESIARNTGKEDSMKGSQVRTSAKKLEFANQKSVPNFPKQQKIQLVQSSMSKYASIQRKKSKGIKANAAKIREKTSYLPVTRKTILQDPARKLTVYEKVQNWLHTQDCLNMSTSVEEPEEQNENIENETVERKSDEHVNEIIDCASSKSDVIHESQGFQIDGVIDVEEVESNISSKSFPAIKKAMQEPQECLKGGSQGFSFEILHESDEEKDEDREKSEVYNHNATSNTSKAVNQTLEFKENEIHNFDKIVGVRTCKTRKKNHCRHIEAADVVESTNDLPKENFMIASTNTRLNETYQNGRKKGRKKTSKQILKNTTSKYFTNSEILDDQKEKDLFIKTYMYHVKRRMISSKERKGASLEKPKAELLLDVNLDSDKAKPNTYEVNDNKRARKNRDNVIKDKQILEKETQKLDEGKKVFESGCPKRRSTDITQESLVTADQEFFDIDVESVASSDTTCEQADNEEEHSQSLLDNRCNPLSVHDGNESEHGGRKWNNSSERCKKKLLDNRKRLHKKLSLDKSKVTSSYPQVILSKYFQGHSNQNEIELDNNKQSKCLKKQSSKENSGSNRREKFTDECRKNNSMEHVVQEIIELEDSDPEIEAVVNSSGNLGNETEEEDLFNEVVNEYVAELRSSVMCTDSGDTRKKLNETFTSVENFDNLGNNSTGIGKGMAVPIWKEYVEKLEMLLGNLRTGVSTSETQDFTSDHCQTESIGRCLNGCNRTLNSFSVKDRRKSSSANLYALCTKYTAKE